MLFGFTVSSAKVTVFPVTLILPKEDGKPWASLPCSAAIKTLLLRAVKLLFSIAISLDAFWILITGNSVHTISPSSK